MVTSCLNMHYIYDRLMLGYCADGRKGVLEQAGGAEQHNITEAAPNELKLARVGKVIRAGYRQGDGVRGCSSGVV